MGQVASLLRAGPDALFGTALSEGRMFTANFGVETTPFNFAGAYDADGPDAYIYVPDGTMIIPYSVRVIFEAVGTQATMEIIAMASTLGDSSATITGGALVTPVNSLVGSSRTSGVTASSGVDATGITSPRGGTDHEFWRFMRPLTDTVASGENDRLPLVFNGQAFKDFAPPIIQGTATTGACMAVHAASQAGTGFITVQYAEWPTTDL